MLNGVHGVAVQIAWNQRRTAKDVLDWANVKCWHLRSSSFVQHGNTFLLHAAVSSQTEGAEENKKDSHVLISSCHPSSGTQGAMKKQQWPSVPNITPACDIHV